MSLLSSRPLAHRFDAVIDGDASTFRVVSFRADEVVSAPYSVVLHLSARTSAVDLAGYLGKSALLRVFDDGAPEALPRLFHGVIVSFQQQTPTSDGIKGHSLFKVVVEPQLSLMTLTMDCKIFQDLSVRQIVDQVLKENNVVHVKWRLTRDLPTREFCCQYQESDLAFVHRLLSEEGIWYCFDHSEDAHTLILTDSNDTGLTSRPKAISYNGASGGTFEEACITAFSFEERIGSGAAVQRDYTFRTPRYNLETARTTDRDRERELFFYPGRYKDFDVGEYYTRLWLEQARSGLARGDGSSNLSSMIAGGITEITDYNPGVDGAYLLIGVTHEGSQPQVMEEAAGDEAGSYTNSFTCIPRRLPFRPVRTVKPRVEGPQTAMVVGPPGEEIYTDEHGRVKVQFPWDRYGQENENASCWIRVTNAWAGIRWGHVALPRIGDEVLVEYLEGDVDQPIITGRAYNTLQKQPYTLPDFKTRMTIQSKTHKGNGYNELRFEDEQGQEEVYVQAEKYMNALIKGDETRQVNGNRHTRVDGNHSESTGGSKDIEVLGSLTEVVTGNDSLKVAGVRKAEVDSHDYLVVHGSQAEVVNEHWTRRVDRCIRIESGEHQHYTAPGTIFVNGGQRVVIRAGSVVSLNVGGNFIRIDESGITIEGTVVNINSGQGGPARGKKVPMIDPHDAADYQGPYAERYARSFKK